MTETVHLPLVLHRFPPPPPVFGVEMTGINNTGGLSHALEAGVHWVRFHAFYWDEIEPVRTSPPTYDWSVVDEESLRSAQANGLEVIAIVHFAPEWAQKYPGSPCGPIHQDALDEYAQFMTELVKRYSVAPYNIRYWELGNEPDAPVIYSRSVFGCWGEGTEDYFGGEYYAEMLKAAYPAIKAVAPLAQVLIGGLLLDCDPDNPPLGKDCKASRFLEGILLNGGGPFFDMVSFHTYTYKALENPNWPGSVTSIPEKTAFIRQVLERYGYGGKGLLNTEVALLCYVESSECFEVQAMYVPRAYAEAMALDLHGQTYYAMINEMWRHTGLLRPDLTPKPVYHAYATASSFLGSAAYQGEVSGYSPGIGGYQFRQSAFIGRVDIIWSADGSLQYVTLPDGASAYDRYGDLIATAGVIAVDNSPVYVVTP
jgi:hypothetical protein